MIETFGDYIETNLENQEYLQIGFSPSSIPLQQRWRNNGLSADFLADYLSTFFPGDDAETLDKRAELTNAVSYVANELLENAMKFSYAPTKRSVSITMKLDANSVWFYTSNSIDPHSVAGYQNFIQHLLAADPDELYIEQLIANAEKDDESDSSGLGFLTMINDYGAALGWKFHCVDKDISRTMVTTMVRLIL